MKKVLVLLTALTAGASLCAAEEQADSSIGRFTFSAGYTWRANVKTDFSGANGASVRAMGGVYDDGTVDVSTGKRTGGTIDTGHFTDETTSPAQDVYHVEVVRSDSVGSGSDEEGMQGVTFAVGYNVWGNEYVDVAARLRFAGYWDLENSRSGGYCRYRDYFGFPTPYPPEELTPENTVDPDQFYDREYLVGGAVQRTKLKADLYQIGLGPQVTWHAFEGWCRPLSWIDVYGNVEILCNIIDSDLDAGGASSSETNCRIGFGANAGILGNITDWFGVFAQIGYEWIDEDDVKCQGVTAETDYSSLVLSAGLLFAF